MFRTIVTVLIGGIAIIFRNVFAYFNAFIGECLYFKLYVHYLLACMFIFILYHKSLILCFSGSIGSCPLAFIFPCLLHFLIVRHRESYFILVKDIVIMIIGIVLSITALVVSIQQMAQKLN